MKNKRKWWIWLLVIPVALFLLAILIYLIHLAIDLIPMAVGLFYAGLKSL